MFAAPQEKRDGFTTGAAMIYAGRERFCGNGEKSGTEKCWKLCSNVTVPPPESIRKISEGNCDAKTTIELKLKANSERTEHV